MCKKILSYDSVSSRILEIIRLQNSLTNRLSSSRVSRPLLLHHKMLLQLIVMIAYPEPVPEPEPAPEPEPEVPDGWDFKPKKPKKPKNPTKSRLLRKSFDDKLYDVETIHAISTSLCEVRQNSSPIEDYTTVLLGHAQLYVFAEKWGIEALKTLSLYKLHKTLVLFTLYAARRPDIAELLRYAYSNEHTPDRVGVVDDLRSLVMQYTVCEMESLINCPEFWSLVGEGGQLAQELVQMLMKRIR